MLAEKPIKPICQQAFAQKCAKKEPFNSCCNDCASTVVTFQCTWFKEYGGQRTPATGVHTVQALGNEEWPQACSDACELLGKPNDNAMWLCGSKELDDVLNSCPLAKVSFPYNDIPWCKDESSLVAATEPSRARVLAAGGAALLVTTAVVGAKTLSRSHSVEENYQPMSG
jgi:hypothetical protein